MATYVTADDMWRHVAKQCLNEPPQPSRVGMAREIVAFAGTVLRPDTHCETRLFDPTYGAAELLWYLSWSPFTEMIERYAPSYSKYAITDLVSGHRVAPGAYGPRWKGQIESVVHELLANPRSRRAVLGTWDTRDAGSDPGLPDKPCTLSLQFITRDEKLDLIATMRSNDVWLGMPYDVFTFTRIQRLVADALGVPVGFYHHRVGSLHLYDKDSGRVHEALERPRRLDLASTFHYRRNPVMSIIGLADMASAAEAEVRASKMTVSATIGMLEARGLAGTELGAMVILCSSRNDPDGMRNPAVKTLVEPRLLQMLEDRR